MSTKRLVYITGAGRGIGRVIALALVKQGYVVAGCARSQSDLDETESLSGGQVRVTSVDVTNQAAVTKWIESETKSTGATPWGLVTAAGIHGDIRPFLESNIEEWKDAIDVNLYGTLIPAQAFARMVVGAGNSGRIIMMSGGGATKPITSMTAYCASKAAVVRFGETLAQELKDQKITVNLIAPGAINTALTQTIIDAGPEKAGRDLYERTLKQVKQGGQSPEHAANLVLHLLKDELGQITGKLISAVWDPWERLEEFADVLNSTDIYTLRRIIPEERKGTEAFVKAEKEVKRS